MLVNLVNEIKGFSAAAEKPSGIKGLFWNAQKAVSDMQTKYDKVDANVDTIASQLENHQVQLLKDVSMFNHLYDMNTQYFKELTMYIIAGEQKLKEVREGELEELKKKAAETGDAMDAQRANDLAANCDRFEKKLHDLKLTRQVALQMAPQIRLLQNNDSLLVERIQSTLSNTLPLWKSQIVIALGMHRSQEALKAQTAVTNMTNELLRKNAEALKTGTIQTAQEAERGIIDPEADQSEPDGYHQRSDEDSGGRPHQAVGGRKGNGRHGGRSEKEAAGAALSFVSIRKAPHFPLGMRRTECQKSGGAGGTASCRGYRGRAPNPCAAALFP